MANCNAHGTNDSAGNCLCNAGYMGSTCNFCQPSFYGYPHCTAGLSCSGHGTMSSETGVCSCNAGYAGMNCDQAR